MSAKPTNADKMRPFIKAMESSIDAARNSRLRPVKPAPVVNHAPIANGAANGSNGTNGTNGVRLKARPKRAWL